MVTYLIISGKTLRAFRMISTILAREAGAQVVGVASSMRQMETNATQLPPESRERFSSRCCDLHSMDSIRTTLEFIKRNFNGPFRVIYFVPEANNDCALMDNPHLQTLLDVNDLNCRVFLEKAMDVLTENGQAGECRFLRVRYNLNENPSEVIESVFDQLLRENGDEE